MIGIYMELPKSCSECNFGNWVNDNIVCEINLNVIRKDSVMDKRADFCKLVDLGKEDMSWEELVEKVKGMPNIEFGEISRLKHIKINVTFNPLYYYESRLFCSKNLAFESIKPYQMYQIIKSLVGDER